MSYIELETITYFGGFENLLNSGRDLRTDSIAGDQSHFPCVNAVGTSKVLGDVVLSTNQQRKRWKCILGTPFTTATAIGIDKRSVFIAANRILTILWNILWAMANGRRWEMRSKKNSLGGIDGRERNFLLNWPGRERGLIVFLKWKWVRG